MPIWKMVFCSALFVSWLLCASSKLAPSILFAYIWLVYNFVFSFLFEKFMLFYQRKQWLFWDCSHNCFCSHNRLLNLWLGMACKRKNSPHETHFSLSPKPFERAVSEVWSRIRFNMSLWAFMTKPFCNYPFSFILLDWKPFL